MKKLRIRMIERRITVHETLFRKLMLKGYVAEAMEHLRDARRLSKHRLALLGAREHPSSGRTFPAPPPYTSLHALTYGVDPLELHYVQEQSLTDPDPEPIPVVVRSHEHSLFDMVYFANPAKYAEILEELADIDTRSEA